MITIVDYGMGNLGSIKNMFKRIGVQSVVTGDISEISRARKLVLPGVGAFDHAMNIINNNGLREILNRKVLVEKVPILGICLGMQLLMDSSEEGQFGGLGWIRGKVLRFPSGLNLKVPHMGWNEVSRYKESALTTDFGMNEKFYFVHSYYVKVSREVDSLLKTDYGVKFDSGIQSENIYGVQFHPEKSHRFGMKVFTNFARI